MVVVELDPAGAEPTVPGSVVVVLDEQEKQPVAVLKAKSTSIEQPKRAIIRCTILVGFIFRLASLERCGRNALHWTCRKIHRHFDNNPMLMLRMHDDSQSAD